VADWELIIGIGIIALALAIDWGLWRHHTKAVKRDLDRFSQESARNREETNGKPLAH
jgi:hypothetical protein